MNRKREFLQPEALARLNNLELTARLVVEGFMSGMHRSPYHGFNVEFSEHRQYMPGDDIRNIDWRVYGKSDRYYVKKFEEETNLKGYLAVDASRSMTFQGESSPMSKLNYACCLAASLAHLMLRQRDSAGLAAFDGQLRTYIPPRGDALHLKAVVSALEELSPGTETGVGRSLAELSRRLVRRGLIIVMSDLLDEPETTLKALRLLRRQKHEVIVFHILDRDELELPYDEPLVFKDLESGEELPAHGTHLRGAYRKAAGAFIETYRMGCGANGIDYALMDTQTPFDEALAAYLSRRRR